MNPNFFRQYLNLFESLEHDSLEDNYQWTPIITDDLGNINETDKTDEIDFSPNDTMEEVIDKVRKNEDNRMGTGKYREGWHHPFDKRLVIKYATPRDAANDLEDCAVRNLWEFMVWHKVRSENMPELKFLMPCYECHPDGLWLTQRKGTRVPADKPVSIKGQMQWVGDRSKHNYAMLDDEVKSIDYATTKAMEHLDLPQEYDRCKKVVRSILDQLGHDYRSPFYGKSKPHEDPLADKD
jgi:hypothetical protein